MVTSAPNEAHKRLNGTLPPLEKQTMQVACACLLALTVAFCVTKSARQNPTYFVRGARISLPCSLLIKVLLR